MSTYKNINSDYTISVKSGAGNVIIDGNLDVYGNITYVSELAVNDAFIAVASDNPGNVLQGGLLFTKVANTSYAGLQYNQAVGAWQISSNVSVTGVGTYANILTTGSSAGGSNTQIQFNNTGGFDGNANLTYDYTSSKLVLTGYQVLGNIGTAPTAVANSVALYNNAPGAGSTGLYVTGNTIPSDEVISLTRARLYAIIF